MCAVCVCECGRGVKRTVESDMKVRYALLCARVYACACVCVCACVPVHVLCLDSKFYNNNTVFLVGRCQIRERTFLGGRFVCFCFGSDSVGVGAPRHNTHTRHTHNTPHTHAHCIHHRTHNIYMIEQTCTHTPHTHHTHTKHTCT